MHQTVFFSEEYTKIQIICVITEKRTWTILYNYTRLDQSVIIYMNVYVVIKFLFRDLGSVFVGGIYFIKEVVEHPPFQPSLWMIIFHNLLSVMIIFPIISSSFPRSIYIWMLFKHDNIQKATKFIQKIPQYTFSCFSYSKSYQQLLKVSAYPYFISVTIISWRVKISCMNVYVIELCNITRNNVSLQTYQIASTT